MIAVFGFLFIGASLFQSCDKDDDNTTPSEFIADNTTFTGFDAWHLHKTKEGVDPANGGLHDNNDSTVVRKIYIKDDASLVNGQYPVGTLIVKHAYSPDLAFNQITGMVKRGNGFNPTTGDWEWFMLMPDGAIATDANGMAMRGGAAMMGGACNSCHSGASAKDFVFSK